MEVRSPPWLTKSKAEAGMLHYFMSLISNSTEYIKSRQFSKSRIYESQIALKENIHEKGIIPDHMSTEKKMSIRRLTQFAPIEMPTITWNTFPTCPRRQVWKEYVNEKIVV